MCNDQIDTTFEGLQFVSILDAIIRKWDFTIHNGREPGINLNQKRYRERYESRC
jgi:hypothetical protein